MTQRVSLGDVCQGKLARTLHCRKMTRPVPRINQARTQNKFAGSVSRENVSIRNGRMLVVNLSNFV
jgi:hypothetical protein